MNSESKHPASWCFVVLIALAALAIRLIHLYVCPMEDRDGIEYLNLTQRWFEQGAAALPSFGRMKPPLFCYLGRALMYCRMSAATAMLSINMFCGVLMVVPAYLIGKTVYDDRKAGLWFAGFTAVMPPLVVFSCSRIREGLYLFFVFWFVWAWLMVIKRRWERGCAMLCGALSIAATYCRYEAVELLVFAFISLPIVGLFSNWQWRRAGWILLSVAGGIVIAVTVFWLLPGLPSIVRIFYSRIYGICLGTSLNPL